MFCAVEGPIPGTCWRSEDPAVLMLIGRAGGFFFAHCPCVPQSVLIVTRKQAQITVDFRELITASLYYNNISNAIIYASCCPERSVDSSEPMKAVVDPQKYEGDGAKP